MALDGHGVLAVEPVPARLEHESECANGIDGFVEAVPGEGGTRPDLDADIRSVELREDVLVGYVVAEVEDGTRGRLPAQGGNRGALVGSHDRQLDDLLAVGHVDVGPRRGAAAYGLESALADWSICAPNVQRDTCRLHLEPDAGMLARDVGELREKPTLKSDELRCESVNEPEIEFGSVTADEVNLARESRECCQITQRPTGDHGHGGLR